MTSPNIDDEEEEYCLGSRLREYRHNPCLMAPVSLAMLIVFGLFMLMTLLLQIPTLVVGFLLAPILSRSSWYVEFLYPWDIARWAHFLLIRNAPKKDRDDDKNRGFHSRTLEQRVEVVPGRVYIHLIPQWLDNIGYLVVCLPQAKSEDHGSVNISVLDESNPIVAFMIDCGDAKATIRAIDLIKDHHYSRKSIRLQAVLSTHKHHDHTGGNRELLSHPLGKNITHVYGGAVERVPYANALLADGDDVVLPCFQSNDMNACVGVESVAVPGHTRGSLVYRLYSKSNAEVDYLFTGDTMFSAGSGVPFEADTGGSDTDAQINKSNGNTFFRGGTGNNAIERCFAEILTRGLPNDPDPDAPDRILILPGHEYTSELLIRQFQASNEACRWKNFAPKEFFETASQLYIAQHRRSLPHNSGRLLMVPSTLRLEISISPHFRSMRRNGEMVVRSIHFWYTNFCKEPLSHPQVVTRNGEVSKKKKKSRLATKIAATPKVWNIDANDVGRDVFTTVYAADLEAVIDELEDGRISKNEAAKQLRRMNSKLSAPVVNKRAIPGFLPSDKNIYRGAVSAMALLGSRPCAMTISDSRAMNLSPPIDRNSDKILISAKRTLQVLFRLGLVDGTGGDGTAQMLLKLWKQASGYVAKPKSAGNGFSADVESVEIVDEIELGILKWVVYGVPANQPSWFSKICCMPCSKAASPYAFKAHPAKEMRQKSGDLVAHDVLSCYLCFNGTGCAQFGIQGRTAQASPSIKVIETESDDEGLGVDGMELDEMTSQLLLKEHE